MLLVACIFCVCLDKAHDNNNNSMARRYVSTRAAISPAQLGQTLSESIGPASIVTLLALFDYKLWIAHLLLPFAY